MRADVKKHGDVLVVSIAGTLHIEETQPFREAARSKLLNEKLVFNMAGASFVGSTGLQPFLEMIKMLDQKGVHGVKLVGVKPEFRRMISILETTQLQFFECEQTAIDAFLLPKVTEMPDEDGRIQTSVMAPLIERPQMDSVLNASAPERRVLR